MTGLTLSIQSKTLSETEIRTIIESKNEILPANVLNSGNRSNFTGEIEAYVVVLVGLTGNIALNIVASALYDLIKNYAVKVKIKGKELKIDEPKTLEEQIKDIENDKN